MRVLLICGSYPPDQCGVGDYCSKLVRQLQKRKGVDVDVLTSTSYDTDTDNRDGESVIYRLLPNWSLRQTKLMINAPKKINPDIAHLQYPAQGYDNANLPWLVPLITRVLGKKIVQTWHEPYSRRRGAKLLLKAIAGGGLIVVRPDFRQLLHPMLRWATWGKVFRYSRSGSTMPVCVLSPEQRQQQRAQYLKGKKRLVVFFGFIYSHKRVELLFDLCDPAQDQIVIAGECKDLDYREALEQRAKQWSGGVDFIGFQPDYAIASLLAVADAVVLPFARGGGDWNTSIQAAVEAGTFVLTTSHTVAGYDAARNTYFSKPEAIEDMRAGLAQYAGTRNHAQTDGQPSDANWQRIADEHLALYRQVAA